MNDVFANIAESGASRLRARIHDDSNFVTAYSELAVAGILQSAGLEPEFEIDVDGVTPRPLCPPIAALGRSLDS